ncbi:MAG: STAS domain-containing protein, partial [Candidatus Coproplasma sp.]
GVKELIIDMKNLEYISSAGLRVLLKTQKAMRAKGTMKLVNVGESVMEVFEITGFSDILTIE